MNGQKAVLEDLLSLMTVTMKTDIEMRRSMGLLLDTTIMIIIAMVIKDLEITDLLHIMTSKEGQDLYQEVLEKQGGIMKNIVLQDTDQQRVHDTV